MLAADKLQLQSALKQQATALKEKEFNLHHSNLMTVGTQAAVLAGLDVTMFIEFTPPPNSEWGSQLLARALKMAYYSTIVAAFCANMMVVAHTTALSVIGAGLALRGPDGSMMTATDGLYEERTTVFNVFGIGLACTVGAITLAVVVILPLESAIVGLAVTLYTARTIYRNYIRVLRRFHFDERDTVDFRDIMEGPAAIQVRKVRNRKSTVKHHHNNNNNTNNNYTYNNNGKSSFRKEEDDDDDYYDDEDDDEEEQRHSRDTEDLLSSEDNRDRRKGDRHRRPGQSRSVQRRASAQSQSNNANSSSNNNNHGSKGSGGKNQSNNPYKIQTV